MNVNTTSEKWREDFKLAVVLELSVSLKEISRKKIRISLFVKNRCRGAFSSGSHSSYIISGT